MYTITSIDIKHGVRFSGLGFSSRAEDILNVISAVITEYESINTRNSSIAYILTYKRILQ